MWSAVPRPTKRWLLTGAAVVCAVSLAAAPRDNATSVSGNAANGNSVSADSSAAMLDASAPPADLRMGNIEFRVQMEPFADTYVGMTHFDTRTVQIDPASQADERRRVYLHELMHVAWHQGHPSADKARKFTEEEAIQALTPGLLKLLAE